MTEYPGLTAEQVEAGVRLGMEQAHRRPANEEMVQGYMDGFDPTSPEPSDNRSHSYRHGFANGRDDRARKPRASNAELIRMADEAMEKDDHA